MSITTTFYIGLDEEILIDRLSGEPLVERSSGVSLVARGYLTDVNDDVFQDWAWEKGIRGKGPQDRVATTGTLNFSLNNGPDNLSGLQGAYSPDNGNCRAGWGIGSRVLVKETDGTNTKYTYWYVTGIEPGAGKFRDNLVKVTAVDYLNILSGQNTDGLSYKLNVRGDQIISYIVQSVPITPREYSIGQGDYVFPYALDATERDESTTIYSVINKVCLSDKGHFYERANSTNGGTLVYESPTTRAAKAPVATFDNSMRELTVKRSMERIYNDIRVTTYPRGVDTSTVDLAKLDSEMTLTAGQTVTITLRYVDQTSSARVAALSTITPESVTDIKFSSVSEDGGSDMNASLSVVLDTSSSNSAEETLTNNHATDTGYLNLCKIRGRGIKTYNPVVSRAEDSASILKYGRRVLRYDMPYQTDPVVGKTFADSLLADYKDPYSDIDGLSYVNRDATLDGYAVTNNIGEKITLSESVTGVSSAVFFIQSENHAADNGTMVKVEYGLLPARSFDG